MKSRIVRAQFDTDSSPSPSIAVSTLPLTAAELGDRIESYWQAEADNDSFLERHSRKYSIDGISRGPSIAVPSLPLTDAELGDRIESFRQAEADNDSYLERHSRKYAIDGISREGHTDARIPVASDVGRDSSRDTVRDKDNASMRERNRDGKPSGDREVKGFISAANGRGSDRDTGSYRDSERYPDGGPSRNRYRHGESGPRPGGLVREELEQSRSRIDQQDMTDIVEPDTRGRFINRGKDSNRGRDGRTQRSGSERSEYGQARPRYDDNELMDKRRSDNADDTDRRPMERGRERGGRGRGGHDFPAAPPLYSLHKATVHSIRPFGIFVRLEGYRNHGLVHLSQVSDHEVTKRDDSEEAKVQALASVAGEGEQVWVKVISVKHEDDGNTKVSCSMKYVSQGDGRDLDSNNVQLEQQQSRPPWQEPQKLKLEAVYNVQCTRCGGHGHLKKECYSSGEKTYELLPEEEDVEVTAKSTTKGKRQIPRETQASGQPPSVLGVSSQMLATGSIGRGRASVQPAWMKHGIGVGGPPVVPAVPTDPKGRPDLPDKVTTVEEALAVIAKLKEEKRRRKEERQREKEKRHSSRDGKKERHKRRHHDEAGQPLRKEHHSSRKKHRTE